MLLTGTYARSVDEKQRLAIPKPLREALAEAAPGPLYLTPGTDGSIWLFAEQALKRLAERLANASPTREDVRAFNRLFYARATPVELDGQGRIRIPAELSRWGAISGDAVLIGVQEHVEIWEPKLWDEYLHARQQRFDAIAEAAFNPGEPGNT